MKKKVIVVEDKFYLEASILALPVKEFLDHDPESFVGYIFKNDNGVYSILTDVEDIVKSNGYFGAVPLQLFVTTNERAKDNDMVIYGGKPRRVSDSSGLRIPMGMLIHVSERCNHVVMTNEPKVIATNGLSLVKSMIGLEKVMFPRTSNEFNRAFVRAQGIGFDKVLVEVTSKKKDSEIKTAPDNTITIIKA